MRVRGFSRFWACFAAFFASVGLATGNAAADAPAPTPTPVLIDVGLHLGGVHRFGEAPAFAITGRAGVSFGVSAEVSPSPRYAFGLAFEHAGLGSERAAGDFGSVDLTRDLDVLWAGLRVYLVRTEAVSLGLLLGPGLAWQGVSANGLLTPGIGALPSTFACAAGDAVNLALRAGLGARFALGSGVSFLADVSVDNVRLASAVLGDCAPGAGTVTLLGARVGFGYQFDVTSYVR
jgi:hypothetical protein